MSAIRHLDKLTLDDLHNAERPVAYLAWQQAEMNRDSKKKKKPFQLEEFYFYADRSKLNLPEARFGAAMLRLIESRSFPTWALFVYKDLKARANDALPPELLCYSCDDAIILAPDMNNESISGMLIAQESCSNQWRTMQSPCGNTARVLLPEITAKVQAIEEASLRIG